MDTKNPSAGTFKCAICGDTFNSNKHLINHKSVHANENRTFKCTKCVSTFTDHCDYLIHEVTHLHHRVEQKCKECGVLKKKITLPIHIMTHFALKKQACEFCNVLFTIEELKKHVRTHTVLNSIRECEICGKKLVVWKYEAHIATHVVKEFPCTYCGKIFQTKKYLGHHTKSHLEERPEVCNICGLFFKRTDELRWHQKKQHVENTFVCDYCGRECSERREIVYHIRKHMRDLKCNYSNCKFSAATSQEVEEHQKSVHFNCKICKREFGSGKSYRGHFSSKTHKDMAKKNLDVDYSV